MPQSIEKNAFISIVKSYVNRLLEGICEDDILLAEDSQLHTVRIVARLSPTDFQAIKFSDLYPAAQKLVSRVGTRYLEPSTNEAHNAEFKLFDPFFEELDFQPPE
jgi:hypothetical protein